MKKSCSVYVTFFYVIEKILVSQLYCSMFMFCISDDSDLISCDIIQKDGTWQHRFLAVDSIEIILVEPDKQRLGWGVAKLVGSLQDLEVSYT